MKIIYFCNSRSPHVARWLSIDGVNKPVCIFDANTTVCANLIGVPVIGVGGGINHVMLKNSLFRYVIAGLIFRFKYREKYTDSLIHSHGAGGNGVMAWLAGLPYVLGVYGTEVNSKSILHRLLLPLKRVYFKKAYRLQVYTEKMKCNLIEFFGVESNKIDVINLGIDNQLWAADVGDKLEARSFYGYESSDLVFFINRRVNPYYQTKEVLCEFLKLIDSRSRIKVVVLEGYNDDGVYYNEVKNFFRDIQNIKFIDGVVSPFEMRRLTLAADFCVSFPYTDEYSAAVIQAIACGSRLIFRQGLVTYSHMPSDIGFFVSIPDFLDLLKKLECEDLDREKIFHKCKNLYVNLFSDDEVSKKIYSFYLESFKSINI